MTDWTIEELNRIGDTTEVHLAPRRRDGTLRPPVPVWVVREGDDVYVRSFRGADGAWFSSALASGAGRLRGGGLEKDVTFVQENADAVNDRIDAVYRAKYRQYGDAYLGPMIAAPARRATLKMLPR